MPGQGAGAVVFLACALFFPFLAALVVAARAWAKRVGELPAMAWLFCLTSAGLHLAGGLLLQDAPARLFFASAGAFALAGFSTPSRQAEPAPSLVAPERGSILLGWLSLAGWIVVGVATGASLFRFADLSSVWTKEASEVVLFTRLALAPWGPSPWAVIVGAARPWLEPAPVGTRW